MKLWEALVLLTEVHLERKEAVGAWTDHQYVARHDVDGHHVSVTFDHDPKNKHHYSANFSVNGATTHSRAHIRQDRPAENRKILAHVAHVVHHFVKHHKPKSLHMHSWDMDHEKNMRKARVYSGFAKQLARVHGGSVKHHSDGASVHWA